MIPAGALRPGHCAVLAILALALFLPGFFTLPVTDRDEARFAQASRQMIESGDPIDIRFQDRPRYKKPAGIYWLQSVTASPFGGAAAPIWAFRLPSIAGAAAAAVLTALIGAALFTPAAGFLAGAILAGTLLLGVEARLAKTDAVLLALVLAAQYCLARVYRAARDGAATPRLFWPFWIALGAGVLVKGPVILLVCGATVAALCAMDRQTRWVVGLRPARGLAVLAAIVLPWLAAIGLRSDGAFFAESVGRDLLGKVASGQESHGAPPGSHLAAFWLAFWPFGFLAAAALPWLWARRRETAVRFLTAWAVPTWLVLEAAATKLPHYALPLYPALALAAAAALDAGADEGRPRWAAWTNRAGVGLHAAASLVLAALFVGLWAGFEGVGWPAMLAPLAGAALGAWLAFPARLRPGARVAGLLAASFLAVGGATAGLAPKLEELWVSPRLAQALSEARPCPDSPLASAGYAEPSLVFHAGAGIRLGDGAAAARRLLADPGCALAAVESREETSFRAALAAAGREARAVRAVEGIDYSRGGRALRITVYRLR